MKKLMNDLLICPVCLPEESGLEVHAVHEQGDDILEGHLSCPLCSRVYPILDGIAYLDPGHTPETGSETKYEQPQVVASYLWSHFADLLADPEASEAYAHWSGLIQPHPGLSLDIGASVGRFVFEMSAKCDLAIGTDNSVAFIKAARELQVHGQKTFYLPVEGSLTKEVVLHAPGHWNLDRTEFIVADAQALPFSRKSCASLASLNMVDKLSRPMVHLQEMNRLAWEQDAQCLISDPFSWSEQEARQEHWLGGTDSGEFAGRGLDNVQALLQGQGGYLTPEWKIQARNFVWWKLRTHANHFELIRSCYLKADR
ncbi:MAG: Trm112 family protein [Desulfovermiculus sp.]